MRVLCIGFGTPHPDADNYSLLRAPALHEYEAVLIDVGACADLVARVVAGEAADTTLHDEPVANGPSALEQLGLSDLLAARQEEVRILLANGGTLAVFARPNAAVPGVHGQPGWDRYSLLPAPAGVAYRPPWLWPAAGRKAYVTDPAHPFAPYLERCGDRVAYRARFDQRAPGLADALRVFGRSDGGEPVAVELRVGAGRIVFLPPLEERTREERRFELAETIVECFQRAARRVEDDDGPDWAAAHTVPGERELRSALEEAQARCDAALAKLEGAEAALEPARQLRRLVWAEGRIALGQAVRRALELLGFQPVDPDPAAPLHFREGERELLVEAEGSPKEVDLLPYFRLTRRLERLLAERRTVAHGLLVVNGLRREDPAERGSQWSETLEAACTASGFALCTGATLFAMAIEALGGAVPQRLGVLRAALLDARGPLTGLP